MKCPVSMFPSSGLPNASVLYVIAVITTVGYVLQARQNDKAKKA